MLKITDILAARCSIAPYVTPSPLEESPLLSERTGARVYLKLENFRELRSFKVRGATNFIVAHLPECRERGVVAASGGSHALGVAYAARRLGVRARVVMTERAPANLAAVCRSYGAEVIVAGEVYDDAMTRAAAIAEETGALFIHSYDDPHIVAGQGTVGLELIEAVPDLDAVICPVGGGGLLGGVGLALNSLAPSIDIYGVEPEQAAAMHAAMQAGWVVPLEDPRSLADKLVVRQVGELNLALAQQSVDDVFLVSEEEIARAIVTLLSEVNLLVEGAAAAAFAALVKERERFAGRKVALVLTGGNIDARVLRQILDGYGG